MILSVHSKYLGGAVFDDVDSDNIVYRLRLDAVPRLGNHTQPPVNNWRTRVSLTKNFSELHN